MRPAAGAVIAFAGALATARGLKDGPPPAHTGGFGEPTCRECHAPAAEEGGGVLRIEGLPERFEAGRDYRIGVVLQRAGIHRAGFQLAIRYADGDSVALQAGALRNADGAEQVITGPKGGTQYAEHTRIGSAARDGRGSWVVLWTAPAASSGVLLHVAAVAANDDDSPLGDIVYLRSVRVGGAARR